MLGMICLSFALVIGCMLCFMGSKDQEISKQMTKVQTEEE